MSAHCYVTSEEIIYVAPGTRPQQALQIANGKLTYAGPRDFSKKSPFAVEKRTMKTHDAFNVCESLKDLGDIDLTAGFSRAIGQVSLCAAGSRNALLEMFRSADQAIQLTVGLPPGVFIGVYRQPHLLRKDSLVVRIRSGTEQRHEPLWGTGCPKDGFQRGNYYEKSGRGKKLWHWNWFDVTKLLNLDVSGVVTIHPKALVLPLKRIFDHNKWW